MDPKFYENDLVLTNEGEDKLDFVRSPFYDLARKEHLGNGANAHQLIDDITMKMQFVETLDEILRPPSPTKENIAYKRYADNPPEMEANVQHLFKFPRGQEYRIINNAELFKVQKSQEHWENVKRSKAFIAEKFFPPFDVRESNLRALLDPSNHPVYSNPDHPGYEAWHSKLLEVIPNLNHDILVLLSLHLAYEAHVNDRALWRAIEDQALASMHHMTMTQVCQMEWATMEQKPKQVSARLNTHLQKRAIEHIEKATASELIDILQGFRQRKSKDMYQRIRKSLIDRKTALFPQVQAGQEKARAELIINLFYTLASNRPKDFGVYKEYAKDELNEVLAHYEEELKEATLHVDVEHLVRLAQALYIFKTKEFETLFWKIEDVAVQQVDKLDIYQITNLVRAFTHSQENKQCGRDKTFFVFESKILKNMDTISDRDVTHLMYAYGVRNVGNPELHKAFEKKLGEIADRLDYPSLHNAIYYMLFREIANKLIWEKIIKATVGNADVLPIIYYRPFKASKFYLKAKYPELDIQDYTDKFWYAERYYNVTKLEENMQTDKTYYKFKGFLNARCFVYPISFMTLHNLFLMHYVFNDQKIAINFHLEKFLPTYNSKPTEM